MASIVACFPFNAVSNALFAWAADAVSAFPVRTPVTSPVNVPLIPAEKVQTPFAAIVIASVTLALPIVASSAIFNEVNVPTDVIAACAAVVKVRLATYVLKSDTKHCFIVPLSFITTPSPSARATVTWVVALPSRIFNSAVVAVIDKSLNDDTVPVPFASNAASNPLVLAIVKLASVIVACFASNAASNPVVLAIVKSPSVIVACLLSICVCIALVTPSKYPYSVLLTSPFAPIKFASNREDVVIDGCFPDNAVVTVAA